MSAGVRTWNGETGVRACQLQGLCLWSKEKMLRMMVRDTSGINLCSIGGKTYGRLVTEGTKTTLSGE